MRSFERYHSLWAALADGQRRPAQPLRDAGLEVDIAVRAAADVAQDMLLAATEHGAGLIVIGWRGQKKQGQNRAQSLTIGSTAAALSEIARRPPLLVAATNERP